MKNLVTGADMPGAHIFETHYIELTKFPQNAGNSAEELWGKFLTAKKGKDLDMLTQENPVMASLVDKLVYASGTKELRDQMDDYKVNEVKNRLTIAYERKDAIAKGMAKGMAKGAKENAMQTAKRLLAKGMNHNDVAEATGLTIDDVLRL